MKEGDEKYELKFAYFPTRMTEGELIWLKTYGIHYKCSKVPVKIVMKYDGKYSPETIYELRWIDIGKTLNF